MSFERKRCFFHIMRFCLQFEIDGSISWGRRGKAQEGGEGGSGGRGGGIMVQSKAQAWF